MSLQEALKLMRVELGMTQADLAGKLHKAVISVNRWENGKGFPSRASAAAILRIAEDGSASEECMAYLRDVLMPDTARARSVSEYGFPDIDRDFLFQLADGSTNSLYVLEEGSYRLLYVNRKAERHAVSVLTAMGLDVRGRTLAGQSDKRCFHYFANRSAPCPFCPLKDIRSDQYRDVIVTIPEGNRKIRVHAKAAEMKGRKVYILYLTDITQEDAELNALYTLTNDIPAGVGIVHYHPDQRIELAFLNAEMYRLIGEERGKSLLRGDPASACLLYPEDHARLIDEIEQAVAQKRKVCIDIRLRIKESSATPIHIDARMIREQEGRRTFYCTIRELTKDKSTAEGSIHE